MESNNTDKTTVHLANDNPTDNYDQKRPDREFGSFSSTHLRTCLKARFVFLLALLINTNVVLKLISQPRLSRREKMFLKLTAKNVIVEVYFSHMAKKKLGQENNNPDHFCISVFFRLLSGRADKICRLIMNSDKSHKHTHTYP